MKQAVYSSIMESNIFFLFRGSPVGGMDGFETGRGH